MLQCLLAFVLPVVVRGASLLALTLAMLKLLSRALMLVTSCYEDCWQHRRAAVAVILVCCRLCELKRPCRGQMTSQETASLTSRHGRFYVLLFSHGRFFLLLSFQDVPGRLWLGATTASAWHPTFDRAVASWGFLAAPKHTTCQRRV